MDAKTAQVFRIHGVWKMNKKLIIPIGCFIAMMSTAAHAGQPQNYFRKIVLLGSSQRIEGRYAVGDSAWADANVYRFSYDAEGRPDTIEYFVGGKPHPDPVFGVAKIAMSYFEGSERRDFEDANGNLAANSARVCSQIIELDTAGHVTDIFNRDAAGNLCEDEFGIAESRFTRTESPDTVLCICSGKNGDMARVQVDLFDSLGEMTEVEFKGTPPDTNHDIPAVVRYAYDDSGDLAFRQAFGKGNAAPRIGPDSWRYDPIGQSYISLGSYRIRNVKTKWKYDGHGNILEEDDFGSDGHLTGKALCAYDGSDRLAKLAYFDSAGAITEAVGDWGQGPDVPPPDFYPVDKEPQIIKDPTPVYPVLAQLAGIEGGVLIKIWVDKMGNVPEVLVLKSDAEIFNKSAVDAAMQAKFTPAIMNGKPVPVWVVIPYTFKLRPRR
jgi:TonB family protein